MDGIEMDVSDQLGQVPVTLAMDRLVPALKNVPDVPSLVTA